MKCVIALNGTPVGREILSRVCRNADTVAAADAGARMLLNAGIVPDLVFGDMDSSGGTELAHLCERLGSRVLYFDVKKDASDGQLALDALLTLGASSVTFFGLTGGRTDMILGNLALLERAYRAGAEADAYAPGEYFRVVGGAFRVLGKAGERVSFLPFGNAMLSLGTGFAYPLAPTELDRTATLTLSNSLTSSEAEGSCSGACLMIKESP